MHRLVSAFFLFSAAVTLAQTPQWTPAAAADWYSKQPWPVGSNYIQSNTVNQIEMWQQETFDSERVDLELKWAEEVGINTLRVFLNDQVWTKDPRGTQGRMSSLLKVADKHRMKVIFVLFDSSGDPYPEIGRQHQPKPGVRNSLWAQSPGAKGLTDQKSVEAALLYAENVVAVFNIDKRILAWDVWNEPENMNAGRFSNSEPPNKTELIKAILPKAFQYVRAGNPTQPVTSGLWSNGDWSSMASLSPIEKMQVELSDFVTFQNYDGPAEFEKRVKWLQAFGRPVMCTGFLNRTQGSTFEAILPVAQKYNVGALARDLVAGKTQTWLPSDSWKTPYVDRKPEVWVQDIFTSTGPPYRKQETDFIKQMIATSAKPLSNKKGK